MELQISRRISAEIQAQATLRVVKRELGGVFHRLTCQKECRIEEGRLMGDYGHMLVRVPPNYAVSQVVGCMKGKSAIYIARAYGGRRRNFVGEHFWARGYPVCTVGRNEAAVRLCIQQQEQEDKCPDQLGLFGGEGRMERLQD